jgi:hypothetical protein
MSVNLTFGPGITVGSGVQFGGPPYYMSGSSHPTDGSISGSTVWSNGSQNPGILKAGDNVRVYDQTGGSTFYYEGAITLIQYSGGFGWEFTVNVTGSGGTANGSPSLNWKIELA